MTLEERNDIITKNLKLVHHIARKMHIPSHASYDYEDLVQEGCIGLTKAVENFDPDRGFEFSTYASSMIKGYMMRYIREHSHMAKYSRPYLDAYSKVMNSGKRVEEITDDDLEELGITKDQLEAVYSMIQQTSLDQEISITSEDSATLLDMIPDPSYEDLSESLVESEIESIKDRVLRRMNIERNIDLIDEWYYSCLAGMHAGHVYLGKKYGISQSYVTRIILKFKEEFLKELLEAGYDVADYMKE